MADPYTKVVNGNGTSVAEYTLPPGVLQYVESVVATVDTSASGAVTPVLTVSEQSGVVIADKPQDDAIAGGGTGRATWALRLAGNGAGIRFGKINTGNWLEVVTTGEGGNFGSGWGITLWAQNKGIVLDAGNGFSLFVDAGDALFSFAHDLTFTVDNVSFFTFTGGSNWGFGGGWNIQIDPGTSVTFQDNLANPIFRIDENGDLHGKTGKALTFDL